MESADNPYRAPESSFTPAEILSTQRSTQRGCMRTIGIPVIATSTATLGFWLANVNGVISDNAANVTYAYEAIILPVFIAIMKSLSATKDA